MNWYHVTVGAFALAALVSSWRTPRSKMWVAIIFAAYVIPVMYIHSPKPDFLPWWPINAGVSFMCDATAYILIRELHKERWEMSFLGSIMFLSATIDLIQTFAIVFGFPPPLPDFYYGSILEVLNVVAFCLIGGIGIMDRLRDVRHAFHSAFVNSLDMASSYAHAKTKTTQPLRKW